MIEELTAEPLIMTVFLALPLRTLMNMVMIGIAVSTVIMTVTVM